MHNSKASDKAVIEIERINTSFLFPLHFFQIIKLLIGWAIVNAKNFRGKTALEIFEVNLGGDQDVLKKLCHQGRRERRFTPTLSL